MTSNIVGKQQVQLFFFLWFYYSNQNLYKCNTINKMPHSISSLSDIILVVKITSGKHSLGDHLFLTYNSSVLQAEQKTIKKEQKRSMSIDKKKKRAMKLRI